MAQQKTENARTQASETSTAGSTHGLTRAGESILNWFRPHREPSYTGSPFLAMRRMMEDMDRMFEGFAPSSFERFFEGTFSPRIEVAEREGQFVVRADLPGMRKEDIQVELRGDRLMLRGERRHEQEEKRGDVNYSERSYGSFVRAIPLPEGVKAEHVDARFDNGVLELTVKLPESSRHRIEIKSAQGAEKRPAQAERPEVQARS